MTSRNIFIDLDTSIWNKLYWLLKEIMKKNSEALWEVKE